MGSLFTQYRPKGLDEVVGQDRAVAQIRRVLTRGWGGRSWFITGGSGTGKTSLALCIAAEGADDLAIEELDAQALTPARLRDIEGDMRYRMLGAKPGKCYIVNEAHSLRKDTIRLLLVVLERLPEHVAWVFTTTKAGEARLFEDDETGDAAPLLSRCIEVTLANDDGTRQAFAQRAQEIAQAEGIDGLPLTVYEDAVRASGGNMRRVLGRIESGAFAADAEAQDAQRKRVAGLQAELGMIRATKGERADKRRAELTKEIAALQG